MLLLECVAAQLCPANMHPPHPTVPCLRCVEGQSLQYVSRHPSSLSHNDPSQDMAHGGGMGDTRDVRGAIAAPLPSHPTPLGACHTLCYLHTHTPSPSPPFAHIFGNACRPNPTHSSGPRQSGRPPSPPVPPPLPTHSCIPARLFVSARPVPSNPTATARCWCWPAMAHAPPPDMRMHTRNKCCGLPAPTNAPPPARNPPTRGAPRTLQARPAGW